MTEPTGPAVFFIQEPLTICESACCTTFAFARWPNWTVEVRNMLVTNVTKPMYPITIFKEAETYRMNRGITPALVEKPARSIKMLKVLRIGFAAPESEVSNFKVRPKMARAVPMRLFMPLRPMLRISKPFSSIVWVDEFAVLEIGQKLLDRRPQACDGFRRVVEIDCKAVCLVVILHESKDIVINVTEEVNLGLDAPIILHIFESWVMSEECRIPATHLSVADPVRILDVLFL